MAKFTRIAGLWKSKKGYSGSLDPLAAHVLGTNRIFVGKNDQQGENGPDLVVSLIFEDEEDKQKKNQEKEEEEIPF